MKARKPVGYFTSPKTNQIVLIVPRKNELPIGAIIRVAGKHGVDITKVSKMPESK